ncbi:eukaryotic initiation factor iso-4F subunit p82-34-like protein [Perkinsela sp. CCAP 1560/4]|nr:eukaryotic initiation factor iso-4F subunit p82-34-like protein [Perkinsela sp. CCAP 1560/4]|eukprot:KNH04667.1 eukaryotic initiation factor iso-4F subunit p82-34-like protein [Perkinsela sp. CCAP 1560/4]
MNREKGKNITSTLMFANSTRTSEERKDRHGTHSRKSDSHSPEFGREKPRSTSSNASQTPRDDIRSSNPGVKHANGQLNMNSQGNPAVTSFSSVRQPAYRKPDATEQRSPGLSHGAPEFQANRPVQHSYGMPAQKFGASGPNTPQSLPLVDEKETMQGHDRFIPSVHPMPFPVMFNPMMGYVQYPPPHAPLIRPSVPQPHASQVQKLTVIIEDDSGNSMNLSTWKEQTETGEEGKAKPSTNVDQAVDPEITEASTKVATNEKTQKKREPESTETGADSADPVVEKQSSPPVEEGPINLTYSLMLSFRCEKFDAKLISNDVIAANKQIADLNNQENRDANRLRYYQPETDDQRSLFGSCVTQAHQQRSNFSNQAENPFTTGRKASLDHISKMKKILQGALNKITPSNYDSLLAKVLEIDFPMLCEDPEVMQDLVGMFFDKAINEPTWANVYAHLCKDIRQRFDTNAETIEDAQKSFSSLFRRALLAHCHKEFDTGRRLQAEMETLPQEEKQKRLLMLRKQTFNNMKFIGALFDQKLITKKVMHNVIYTALFTQDELTDEALEMCCELLTSIGERLEEHDAGGSLTFMDTYFSKFYELTKRYPTARVRFKLQNLIDLRESKWDSNRHVPETPLELKSRSKSFSSGSDRHKQHAAPPPLLPMKKVMNRQPSSSHKPLQRSTSRSSDEQRSPQPTTPMTPATPATPMTPKTPQYVHDRKKWREVLPNLMKDQHELVETLQDYTTGSRKAFLEELFNYLLSVRFREERQSLRKLLPEFIQKGIINKREIEQTCVKCVREWVKEETIMDQPKLWDSWAEIFCVCMQCESLSSAESIEVAWKELIAKDNAEHIAIFISDINNKLRNNIDIGVFLRTLDLMSRPELYTEVMQSDKANNPLFDSSLQDFAALRESKMALLADGSSDLDVQKRVYVLMSFLVLHFENQEVALTVVKYLKNILDILKLNKKRAEMLFLKELMAARQFMENKGMKSDVEEFLIAQKIMQ